MNTPSAKARTARTALLLCALSGGAAFVPLANYVVAAPKEEAKPDMIFTEANDGQTVQAHVGEVFEVRLDSNASTGYSWNVASQETQALEMLGDPKYVRPTTNAPGAGSQQVFRFKIKRIGATKLVLHYKRPWEQDKPPAQVFSLGLQVAEKK